MINDNLVWDGVESKTEKIYYSGAIARDSGEIYCNKCNLAVL